MLEFSLMSLPLKYLEVVNLFALPLDLESCLLLGIMMVPCNHHPVVVEIVAHLPLVVFYHKTEGSTHVVLC